MRKIILVNVFILLYINVFAQKTDSLLNLLDKERDRNNKIDLLIELFTETIATDFNVSISYADEAIKLAAKEKEKEKEINVYHQIGNSLLKNGYYSKSLEYYSKSLELSLQINNDSITAYSYHKSGNAYLYQDKLDEALDMYLKALDIREKIKEYDGLSATLNNLGIIYLSQSDFEKALENNKKSLEYAILRNDTSSMAASYNALGANYEMADLSSDSAIYFHEKAIELYNILGDEINLASSYSNIADIYLNENNLEKATDYHKKAMEINLKLNDTESIVFSYIDIAKVFNKKSQIDSAEFNYFTALKLAKSINSVKALHDIYKSLGEISYLKGNYKDAADYKDLYKLYNDSIFKQEIAFNISNLNTKYETEKVEQENEIQKLQIGEQKALNKAQKNLIYFFGILIVVILIFTFIVLKQFRDKKKAYQELELKNAEILQQKEEINAQAENLLKINNELSERNEEILQQQEEILAQSENLNIAYKKISLINEQMKASIRYAYTIQQAMLPYESTIDKLFNNFVIYRPKDIVSGDFYWVNEIEGSKYIAVVDCTGHGVPGAFMSMIGISLLDEILIARKIYSPKDILEKLASSISVALNQEQTNNNDGMDVCICKIDDLENDTFRLTFAGAKRDLFYFDNNHSEILIKKGSRRTIGGIKSRQIIDFEQHEIILNKNSIIYLSTDGLVDQNNNERKRFGTQRLLNILNQNLHKSLNDQKLAIEKELNTHQDIEHQRDDITFVGVKL